jgi:hypothetical protein
MIDPLLSSSYALAQDAAHNVPMPQPLFQATVEYARELASG